jgi:hypothetical protein
LITPLLHDGFYAPIYRVQRGSDDRLTYILTNNTGPGEAIHRPTLTQSNNDKGNLLRFHRRNFNAFQLNGSAVG